MRRRVAGCMLGVALVASACTSSGSDADDSDDEASTTTASAESEAAEAAAETTEAAGTGATGQASGPWPKPEGVPTGELADELDLALGEAVILAQAGIPPQALTTIAESGDARAAWVVVDLLRFFQGGPVGDRLAGVYSKLTGAGVDPFRPWHDASNQMIAWDIPAPPNYIDYKRQLFSLGEPKWSDLLVENSDVDWRHVSWGGVLLDDRPLGDNNPCLASCIPALDDPGVTDAAGGDWYPDDRLIFGIVVNGEARAYPKNIMEVHEMVNDGLGGRRVGIPYCTLCGSAQAYYVDDVTSASGQTYTPVLRTSGLLIRSNKMMFDLETFSLIDTFTGRATSGPLFDDGLQLEQLSVVTTTWGQWKAEHPDTTIVAEDGGIGRTYPEDPLGGRDDDGPIFPIGDADDRLGVQEPVLGIFGASGDPIAVPVNEALAALGTEDVLVIDGITVVVDGGGLRAFDADGNDAGSHQAFWFAWSQFHPETRLWPIDFE